ncbi:hypothetical protein L596_005535 [Steinernema carpocapsae]|uniref:Uncharacterized protein n=1 Tax=Steinernema carpocapsae TaxID=34508 RepID=A0A4V6I8N6_STECR|nr:hypothetical protein L596_005535 [Steinernema carpocapsae]
MSEFESAETTAAFNKKPQHLGLLVVSLMHRCLNLCVQVCEKGNAISAKLDVAVIKDSGDRKKKPSVRGRKKKLTK